MEEDGGWRVASGEEPQPAWVVSLHSSGFCKRAGELELAKEVAEGHP